MYDTIESIMAAPVNDEGWHEMPDGRLIRLGDGCTLGNRCKLGNGCKLGSRCTSLDLVRFIIAAQPDTVIMHKWVKSLDRSSPGDNGILVYNRGEVVVCEGEVSDEQCAAGIHLLRPGIRPEYVGLNFRDAIPLRVEVRREDILFAGLPGWDSKWRVRACKVLD